MNGPGRPAAPRRSVLRAATVCRRPLLPAVTALAAIVLAAAVLAGCTDAPAASGTAVPTAGQATAPAARGTATPSASASGSSSTAAKCNAYASSLAPLPGAPNATSGSFMATIRKRGYLVAGVDQNTYHFGYLNPLDGQFEGFDIDMVEAVAQAIFGSPGHIRYRAISDAQRRLTYRTAALTSWPTR